MSEFKIGQRYIGEVNGALLEVKYIKRVPKNRYREDAPRTYSDVVGLEDVKTCKVWETELETAKRLILREVA